MFRVGWHALLIRVNIYFVVLFKNLHYRLNSKNGYCKLSHVSSLHTYTDTL